MSNREFKRLQFLVGVGGVGSVLLLVILVFLLELTERKSPTESKIESTFFIETIQYELQKNLERNLNMENTVEHTEFVNTTLFGQPLNKMNQLVLFGSTWEEYTAHSLEDTLACTLRKMYINDIPENIYSYADDLQLYKNVIATSPTSLLIKDLDTLDDGNNTYVASQLRASIVLFVKGYLGLNLQEVQVIVGESNQNCATFSLVLDPEQNIELNTYKFTYSYNADSGEVYYIIIEKG